jgi:ribokinase
MARIAVVGSANVDLCTFTDVFPKPGETIFAPRFDLGFGGKGANQAVAARLCGAEVSMVARVGDDLFGRATIENFAAFGIDSEHVEIVDGVSTGVAPIFVESSGENRIFVVKGANDRLLPRDVERAEPVLARADCVVLQLEVPLETVYFTLGLARKLGVRTILNPAPAQKLDLELAARADYFVPNETEAESIASRSVASLDDARACASELQRRGFARVVLTLGARGAVLAGPEGVEHFEPFPVATTDSTGAGDAFIGSFAAFLAEGCGERDALRRACLYAAMSTTKIGTQKSFPDRGAFDRSWKERA